MAAAGTGLPAESTPRLFAGGQLAAEPVTQAIPSDVKSIAAGPAGALPRAALVPRLVPRLDLSALAHLDSDECLSSEESAQGGAVGPTVDAPMSGDNCQGGSLGGEQEESTGSAYLSAGEDSTAAEQDGGTTEAASRPQPGATMPLATNVSQAGLRLEGRAKARPEPDTISDASFSVVPVYDPLAVSEKHPAPSSPAPLITTAAFGMRASGLVRAGGLSLATTEVPGAP